jgi:hypothetical protein
MIAQQVDLDDRGATIILDGAVAQVDRNSLMQLGLAQDLCCLSPFSGRA